MDFYATKSSLGINRSKTKKDHRRIKSNEEESPPLKPYYYSESGNLHSNPIPYCLTSLRQSSLPLKYREASFKKPVTAKPGTRKDKKLPEVTSKKHMQGNIWGRDVWVVLDGSNLPGFTYSIPYFTHLNRTHQILLFETFLSVCSRKFKAKCRFAFTLEGKVIKTLAELPPFKKNIVVGESRAFKGSHQVLSTSLTINYKDNSTSSPRKKGSTTQFSNSAGFSGFRTSSEKFSPAKPDFKNHTQLSLRDRMGCNGIRIEKGVPKLSMKEVQKFTNHFGFSKAELYRIYAIYKTMLLISCGQNPDQEIKNGINKKSFVECISAYSKGEDAMITKIIDSVGASNRDYIKWDDFVVTMSVVSVQNLDKQIEMLFSIYDTFKKGFLSFEEVKHICKVKLQLAKEDEISSTLYESFAKVLFDISNKHKEEGLSANDLKQAAAQGKEAPLVELFCSFNFPQ